MYTVPWTHICWLYIFLVYNTLILFYLTINWSHPAVRKVYACQKDFSFLSLVTWLHLHKSKRLCQTFLQSHNICLKRSGCQMLNYCVLVLQWLYLWPTGICNDAILWQQAGQEGFLWQVWPFPCVLPQQRGRNVSKLINLQIKAVKLSFQHWKEYVYGF